MTSDVPRVGVVTFPGSLDDRDALRAVETMGGEPRRLWHADHDLRGVDAVVLPGGFSYGDYLRTGAIARFAPVMDGVRAFAERGGPVLGICNGFQILCESGLLPGALIRNASLRFVCRDVHLRVETSQTPVTTRARRPARCSRSRSSTARGSTCAAPSSWRGSRARASSCSATAPPTARSTRPHNPNGSANGIAGVRNAAGNVVGLMPHPEHAVDPDVGPTGGQPLFASLLAQALARV